MRAQNMTLRRSGTYTSEIESSFDASEYDRNNDSRVWNKEVGKKTEKKLIKQSKIKINYID